MTKEIIPIRAARTNRPSCRSSLTEETRRHWPSAPPTATTGSGGMGRPDRTRTSGPYRRTADFRASTTDPDASPLRPNGIGARLGYHDHYVVDGGKARIILTVLVTPAEVQDNQPAVDLLWRTRFRWKLHPRQVTGDTKYGTVENIVGVEDQRMRAYCPALRGRPAAGSFPVQRLHLRRGLRHLSLPEWGDPPFPVTKRVAPSAGSIRPRRPPARPAPSAPGVRPRRAGVGSADTWTRSMWSGCAATTRPKPMPRRCASGRSGWNRCSPKPSSGTGCNASGCGVRRRSTSKPNSSPTGQNLKRLLSKSGWGRRPWPNGATGVALPVAAPPICARW